MAQTAKIRRNCVGFIDGNLSDERVASVRSGPVAAYGQGRSRPSYYNLRKSCQDEGSCNEAVLMGVVHKRVNLTITRRSRAFSARWSKFAAALLCLVLVFCCCIFSPATAMPETGRIWGKVLDPQGSPVENAHVKILNSSGALTRESTSDSLGNFSFEHIDIGQYRIVAEYPSFAAVTVGISILAGRPREINLQ